eukprot:SAG31_NODE_169_length_21415_cov_29.765338_13_plen_95_part_00
MVRNSQPLLKIISYASQARDSELKAAVDNVFTPLAKILRLGDSNTPNMGVVYNEMMHLSEAIIKKVQTLPVGFGWVSYDWAQNGDFVHLRFMFF